MGIAIAIISYVPAVTQRTVPQWVYWLAAAICVLIAFFQTWSEQYDRAAEYKGEVDDLYADLVLDWLKQHNPAQFNPDYVAKDMKWDQGKVVRGLKTLERTYKGLVRNDGPYGWIYDPMQSIRLNCQYRKL
jgi:hypothetical protein